MEDTSRLCGAYSLSFQEKQYKITGAGLGPTVNALPGFLRMI